MPFLSDRRAAPTYSDGGCWQIRMQHTANNEGACTSADAMCTREGARASIASWWEPNNFASNIYSMSLRPASVCCSAEAVAQWICQSFIHLFPHQLGQPPGPGVQCSRPGRLSARHPHLPAAYPAAGTSWWTAEAHARGGRIVTNVDVRGANAVAVNAKAEVPWLDK